MTCHCEFPPEWIRVRPIKGRTHEEATFYNWKAKYGGMEVSEAKRLKALEDENARLKKLLAEQMLDAAALRELLQKKW
ncbi:putative transposase [Rhizobium leguminosarum]|uniref:Putative transposase n=1 Tax=Rhizobium leguminosarum TaxID=384 RepID=A0A7W9ZQS5_RHILE|nr:putative transposase [Rhizobium leguminosarum]MBB6221103.1 putative transposase [Rhizobium leguminosarum]